METFGPVDPALLRWEQWISGISDEMTALDRAFVAAGDPDKIAGHLVALTTVMLALKRAPGFKGELIILRDLHARLEKLSVGQKAPIMSVIDSVRTPGRPPASSSEGAREAHAVALVQFAVESGWSEQDACDLVAKELASAGVKGRRGKPLQSDAVRGWRSDKMKQTNDAYKVAMALLQDMAPTELSVKSMRTFVRRFIGNSESLRD